MATPIKTVVIIVKENHTFDNYFGAFPNANGDPSLPQAPNPPTSDPNHTHQAWLDRKSTATRLGYKEADIPAYFSYARQFTLCDNYFSAVAGPSTPNHLMLIAADSPLIDNPPSYRGRKQQTYDLPSLPDQLDAAGLTWRNYGTGYPFDLITKLGTRNMKPSGDFAGDAAAGQLPNVAWVYAPAALDEHPNGNVTNGANWTAAIVDAVAKSSHWPEAVVFSTWDCWGGWVDHVDPPALETWSDGTQFYPGGRVGCLVISPYAKRGYVSHVQHTHVSIVKFCEVTFGLRALNQRDTASDGMEDCFDFTKSPDLTLPQAGVPAPARRGAPVKRVTQKAGQARRRR